MTVLSCCGAVSRPTRPFGGDQIFGDRAETVNPHVPMTFLHHLLYSPQSPAGIDVPTQGFCNPYYLRFTNELDTVALALSIASRTRRSLELKPLLDSGAEKVAQNDKGCTHRIAGGKPSMSSSAYS